MYAIIAVVETTLSGSYVRNNYPSNLPPLHRYKGEEKWQENRIFFVMGVKSGFV